MPPGRLLLLERRAVAASARRLLRHHSEAVLSAILQRPNCLTVLAWRRLPACHFGPLTGPTAAIVELVFAKSPTLLASGGDGARM